MALADIARILRASQVRYDGVRVRGVPAILLGVTSVVLAGGAVRVLVAAAPSLPDALREAAALVRALRRDGDDGERPRLKP